MEPLNTYLKLVNDTGCGKGWYDIVTSNSELGVLPSRLGGRAPLLKKIAEAIDSRGEYEEEGCSIVIIRTNRGFLLGDYEYSSPYLTYGRRFVGVLISFDAADYFSAHIKLTLRATA